MDDAVVLYKPGGVATSMAEEMIQKSFLGAGFGGQVHIVPAKRGQPMNLRGLERVLLLGDSVVKQYTGMDKLTQRRGSWYPVLPEFGGVPSLVGLEPGWFNRGMLHKYPLLMWDVQKFIRGPKNVPEHFILNPKGKEFDRNCARLESVPIVSSDTEWYGPYEPAYISFGDGNGWAFTLKFGERDEEIQQIFDQIADQTIVWQNGMFDMVFLELQGFRILSEVEDTMVAFHTAYPDLRQKSLGTISSIYTPRSYYKEEVEFVGEDDEAGQIYCCRDVDTTGMALPQIESDLKATKTTPGYKLSMSVFSTFKKASVVGLRVDRAAHNRLRNEYTRKANEIEDKLRKAVGEPELNCRSSQQVQKLVFDKLGFKDRKRTSKQEALMDIAADPKTPEHVRAVLTAIIRVRQNRKIVSSYFNDNIFGRDGRVRCSWNLAGTRSGRLSSTKMWGQGLALQTVPRNARGIFVPDPGNVFLGFDLAQAEARVVAVLTRDFDLLEHMNSGTDIHCLLGSQIPQFEMTYEELMAKKKEEGGDFRERYLSKKLRHSINYVASPNSIKASINRDYLDTGVGVSLQECRGLHERALEIHPGLPRWWRDVKQKCYANMGEIVNPFGRRRNFAHAGRITDHLHREAVSFYPQSTIADLTTQIIARFDRALDGRGVVLAHMHDGMFAQIPENFVDEALSLLKEAAHIPFNVEGTELLIPVDYKVSAESWGALG